MDDFLNDIFKAGSASAADPIKRKLFGTSQFIRALFGANPDTESYRQAGYNSGRLAKDNLGKFAPLSQTPWEEVNSQPVQATPSPTPTPTPVYNAYHKYAPGVSTGENVTDQAWREAEEAAKVQEVINRTYGSQGGFLPRD